jgi:predicted oxidoreductase
MIQPIIGTTNLNRIKEASTATEFFLSREEWYALSTAALGILP